VRSRDGSAVCLTHTKAGCTIEQGRVFVPGPVEPREIASHEAHHPRSSADPSSWEEGCPRRGRGGGSLSKGWRAKRDRVVRRLRKRR